MARQNLDWAKIFDKPSGSPESPFGKHVNDYAYLALLPIASSGMQNLVGYQPDENALCEWALDSVFRYTMAHAPALPGGDYADKGDAAAQLARDMARELRFTQGVVSRAQERLTQAWLQLIYGGTRRASRR